MSPLLIAAPLLHIVALVMLGIAALFVSMPLKYQPGATQLFIDLSSAYLHYGPRPKQAAEIVLVAFSLITILLACSPLFDALRSSGPSHSRAGWWLPSPIVADCLCFSFTMP